MLKQLLIDLFRKKPITAVQLPLRVLSPLEITAHLNSAIQLHQQGQFEQAQLLYEEVIANDDKNADALHLLGLIKHLQNKHEEAITLLTQSLTIKPSFAEARVNLGVILRSAIRYEESLHCFDTVLSSNPSDLNALYNCGNLLLDMQKPDDALIKFNQYLKVRKNNPDVFLSKGIALHDLHHYEDALDCYNKAIGLDAKNAKYHFSKGNVLRALQRYDEAIHSYEQARLLQPDYAGAHQNEGLTRLLVGDYKRGWPQYEWRWSAELAAIKPTFTQPSWDGKQSLKNKKILLIAEQGFGDTIQFSRYINQVVELGATVYLLIPKPLLALFNHAKGVAKVCVEGEPLPPFDYCYPLMSLALAFDTRLDSIPSPEMIFTINKTAADYWTNKISALPTPRVGIFWYSTTSRRVSDNQSLDVAVKNNLALRNISLSEFADLFFANLSFISLQKETLAEDIEQLKKYKNIYHCNDHIEHFGDTAALIAQVDLVITIDTAVAHLAGTMGKPVWILLPFHADWRWLLNRTDSPWYPAARLFRQPSRGDWASVLADVSKALTHHFSL